MTLVTCIHCMRGSSYSRYNGFWDKRLSNSKVTCEMGLKVKCLKGLTYIQSRGRSELGREAKQNGQASNDLFRRIDEAQRRLGASDPQPKPQNDVSVSGRSALAYVVSTLSLQLRPVPLCLPSFFPASMPDLKVPRKHLVCSSPSIHYANLLSVLLCIAIGSRCSRKCIRMIWTWLTGNHAEP
jgi:hypothetical protein